MAGWKFWEWESDDEKNEREANDFLTRANDLVNKSHAESFVKDATSAFSSAAANFGKMLTPGEDVSPSRKMYSAIGNAWDQGIEKVDQGLSQIGLGREQFGLDNPLQNIGLAEKGARIGLAEAADIGSAFLPGKVGKIADVAQNTSLLGKLVESPLETASALGVTGAAAKGISSIVHKGVRTAGKYQDELAKIKTPWDLLEATDVTRPEFPNAAIKDIVANVKTLLDETGGATYNVHLGDKLGSDEFAVGIFEDRSRVIDGIATEKDIRKFIEDNKNVLRDPRVNVGLWANEGKTYMDLSVTFPDEDMAKEVGRKFNQMAIYDLKNQQEIEITGTVAGRETITLIRPDDGKNNGWFVASEGQSIKHGSWNKLEMNIGEGGLISAKDKAGMSEDELRKLGYKGVYYPDHDQVDLFEKIEGEKINFTPKLRKEDEVYEGLASKFLNQVQEPLTINAITGAVEGGIQGYQASEGEDDPVKRALYTIEGAAVGSAQKVAMKKALTIMVKNGAPPGTISNFDRNILITGNRRNQIPRSDNLVTKLVYNSLLSGPATIGGQVISAPVEIVLKTVRDVVSSVPRSVITGNYGHLGDVVGDGLGLTEGFFQGSRAFADGMVHLVNQMKNGNVLDSPTVMIDSIDMWTRATIYGMSVGYNAAQEATKLGLSQTAKIQYIKQALADPIKNMGQDFHDDALSTALRATYMGETGSVGQRIGKFARGHPVLEQIFPFVGVVHRVMMRGMELTPVGLAGTAFDIGTGVYTGGMRKEALDRVTPLRERLGNNMVGSAFFGYFYLQATNGNITAYGPEDQSTRDAMIRQGWQPYSFKFADGNWYDYRRLGPLAQVIAMAATPAEIVKYSKDGTRTSDLWKQGLRAYAGLGEEMSYIRGLTDIARALTYAEGGDLLESIARRFVPYGAFLSSVANGFDPYLREVESVGDSLQSMIPGFRNRLPERLDVYGQPRENPKTGLSSILPFRRSVVTPNAIDEELRRLDVAAGRVRETITDEFGNEKRLTQAEKRQFQTVAGDGKRKALELLIGSEFYKSADELGKKQMVASVIRHAQAWGTESVSPGTVKDAELSKYGNDPVKAAEGLIKAIETQQKLKALLAKKYRGKTKEEAEEIDDWKSSLAAFRSGYGQAIGDQAFKAQYGFKAYILAKNSKISEGYRISRSKLIETNPDYNAFFGSTLDVNEVRTARQLIAT